MSKSGARTTILLRVLLTGMVGVFAFGAERLGWTETADRRIQDAFVRLSPNANLSPSTSIPDVAVVTIDPRSLRAFDDWPWPRSRHAEAVDRLREVGARAVAFDIDFSSPPTTERAETENRVFAQSLRRSDHVVLATFSQFQPVANGAEMEIVNRPLEMLERAAAGLGSVLVPIDSDGTVRHAPRESPIGGEPIPSLARSALRVAAPAALAEKIAEAHSASDRTLVDYRRFQPAIPTVPYLDLIEGHFDPEILRGRAVFIGATAAEFQDLWPTPVAPNLPGVMIQAIAYRTAVAEALGETVVDHPPSGVVLAGFLLLAAMLFPWNGMPRMLRIGTFVAAAGGLFVAGWFALWQWGTLLPVTAGLAIVAAQYALGIESLQSLFRAKALAQESSLTALARIGEVTTGSPGNQDARSGGPTESLELALELLGQVVGADGVVLLRANGAGQLTDDRIEWRAQETTGRAFHVDRVTALQVLGDRKPIETLDVERPSAPIVFTPLLAGNEAMGVLILFGEDGQKIDALGRRTISTIAAQMALTAQNIQLIERLRETFESSIAAVAGAVEARDGYTDQHCRRLAAFSSLMGVRLGMSEENIRAMALGALLHDVGKIGIPDAVLNKPGRLSTEERRIMERHPEIGAGIVAPVVGLDPMTLDCVFHHHERWDGQGYPEGLVEEEIPLAARIVSIVDVWDALSTRRPYKKAFSQEEVRDILLKGRGTHFDPDLVNLFFEVLEEQGEEMLDLVARSSRQGVDE